MGLVNNMQRQDVGAAGGALSARLSATPKAAASGPSTPLSARPASELKKKQKVTARADEYSPPALVPMPSQITFGTGVRRALTSKTAIILKGASVNSQIAATAATRFAAQLRVATEGKIAMAVCRDAKIKSPVAHRCSGHDHATVEDAIVLSSTQLDDPAVLSVSDDESYKLRVGAAGAYAVRNANDECSL